MFTRSKPTAFLATVFGLAAMAVLVSCGTVAPGGMSDLSTQASVDESESGQARQPAGLLVRKIEPRLETNISLLQYRQADEYLRLQAPSAIGLPVLLTNRYAQTEHMPIFLMGADSDLSSSRDVDWGFVSSLADFDKHVRIVEGRLANPAKAGDSIFEAVMMTEKLEEIGAKVGDYLVLVYRTPGGDPEPIEVRIVGRWAPLDAGEAYWFYPPPFFKEGIMVPEETYIDVLLPRWREIGYEYTWYTVLDADESDVDAISTGISQIQADLEPILGKVKIDVVPHYFMTQGGKQGNSQ